MIIESVAILMIIAVVMFGYLRTHKKRFAIATLPFLVVPFANILGELSSELFASANKLTLCFTFNMVGLGFAVLVLALSAWKILSGKRAVLYMTLGIIYSVALVSIYIINKAAI